MDSFWITYSVHTRYATFLEHPVHDLKVPFRVLSLELDIRPRPYVTVKRAFMI
jgi:hypothetical protein